MLVSRKNQPHHRGTRRYAPWLHSLEPLAALPCSNAMFEGSQNCIFFQFRLLGFRQCPFGRYAMSVPVRLRMPGPGASL